jgi:hypothetical protein
MFMCRLCGLTLDKIPDDAIQCGKLYRFTTGEFHDLRKKLEPRSGPRPRRRINPDREAPPLEPTLTSRGTHAHQVPETPEVEPEPTALNSIVNWNAEQTESK